MGRRGMSHEERKAHVEQRAQKTAQQKSYAVSDDEFRQRVAAYNRENPRKETAKHVADKYIAPDGGPPKDAAEVERLARLSKLQYERERKEAAEKLGVKRVSALDAAVKSQRDKKRKEEIKFLPHWTVEPWPQSVDGDALLKNLQAHFKRYIVLPDHADTALALWVLHTWVFECFDITPYLCISSPAKRCGKTLLMTMLLWLCCRAKKNDSMSKAAIYRSVERDKPTLVLDEVGWVVDQKDERQNILCGGFERNGHAEICEGEGADIAPKMYATYCPKAFGLIGKLTATLMDRSIEIQMRRKLREPVERLRRRDNDDHAAFRSQCLRWANDNGEALAAATPSLPDKLHDRAADYWEPLLAIAAHVGGEWTKLATDAAITLSGGENAGEEKRVELLQDIKGVFDAGLDEITTKALLPALCADEERPWATYNKGKPISAKQVASLLRSFPILSETVHAIPGSGDKDAKGYKRERFEDAFRRYLIPAKDAQKTFPPGFLDSETSCRPNADETGTSSVFCKRPESNPDGSENSDLSYSPSGSDVRTATNPQTGDEECFGEKQPGQIVANGYDISSSPDDRREPEPGQIFCRVRIREIWHPPIKSGPDDDLADFAPL